MILYIHIDTFRYSILHISSISNQIPLSAVVDTKDSGIFKGSSVLAFSEFIENSYVSYLNLETSTS